MKKRKVPGSSPVEETPTFETKAKRRKLHEVTEGEEGKAGSAPSSAASHHFVWAQVYSFPYWPAKILLEDRDDIPADVLEQKKKQNNLTCVEFFGKHEYAWVPPSKLVELKKGETIPPGPKRAKQGSSKALAEAIREAQEEILATENQPRPLPAVVVPPPPPREVVLPQPPAVELQFIGLNNLGNTCYINSALQCLFRVGPFCTLMASFDIVYTARCQQAEAMRDKMEVEDSSEPTTTGADSLSSGSAASAAASHSEHHQPLDLLVAFRSIMRILSDPTRLDDADIVDDDMNILSGVPAETTPASLPRSAKGKGRASTPKSDGANGSSALNRTLRSRGPSQPSTPTSSAATTSTPSAKKSGGVPLPAEPISTTRSGTNRFRNAKTATLNEPVRDSEDEDVDIENIDDDPALASPKRRATNAAVVPASPPKSHHFPQYHQSSIAVSSLPPLVRTGVRKSYVAHDFESFGMGRVERSRARQLVGVLRAFKQSAGELLDEKYLDTDQQDISEFVMHLLEYTHLQLKNRCAVPNPQLLHVEGCQPWNKYVQSNLSPVVASFDGVLLRTRTCPKGHEFKSHEIFRTLPLHFPEEDGKEITLEEMMRNLRHPEHIECRCSKCGGTANFQFSQVTDVLVCPRFLIITLSRFKSSMRQLRDQQGKWWAHKVKTKVKFPLDGLDLSQVFKVSPGQPKPVYNLVAITNHRGSLMGGHYFAQVRTTRSGQQWQQLSDDLVKPVHNPATLVTNHAYMLFYERVTD